MTALDLAGDEALARAFEPCLNVSLSGHVWYHVMAIGTFGVLFVTKKKVPAPLQVTFYTKAGCHLCEEARDMLEDIAALTTYELTEIDIRNDPATFEKYRYRIPVITINGDTTIEGRIEFRDLAKAFHLR